MDKTKDLLPISLVGDKNVEALCESADHVFQLNNELYKLIIYARIDELPEEVLDLLAWQFHIEGYEFAEDIWEKRKLIKEFYELHKIKGTVAGIKKALELAKAKPLRIYTPFDKTFLSLSMNDEERKAWFALFPELRLKRFKARGKGRANKFLGNIYTFFSDAPLRFGYRAYYIYKGK
ncbi:MAG: phage tail protein, partial [Nitrososphaeria archaeon]